MFLKVDASDTKASDLIVTGMEGDEGSEGTHLYFNKLDGSGLVIDSKNYTWYEFGTKGEGDEYEQWMYGWYADDGSESYNDELIPAGDAVWVTSDNVKYSIQSSGAVANAPISVTLRGGNYSKLVANPMPATVAVGDIKLNGMEGEEGSEGTHVYFNKLNGSGLVIDSKNYTWYEFGTKGEGDEYEQWMYGWYADDGSESYNSETLGAGEAIWVTSDSTKYSVEFPSPLQK